jgi:dihydrodipicolinate synthase/N-acetylneuraminate lyase
MKEEITGLITALAVPFSSNGEVDNVSLIKHVKFLEERGVRQLLVNGTTGEFFSLTIEERRGLFMGVRQAFTGKVFNQAGCSGLGDTIEEARWSQANGTDAVVVISPYYFAGVSDEGIIKYYQAVSECVTSVPFILYNFPRHTKVTITPQMLKSINHYGIKDSSVNVDLIPAAARYYTGGDSKILSTYKLGAKGFISGYANLLPVKFVEMEAALAGGDMGRAEALQQDICSISEVFGGSTSLAKIKYALSQLLPGYKDVVRFPIMPALGEEQLKVKKLLKNFQG